VSALEFQLDCDAMGHWTYVSSQGVRHEQVTPVRSFPVAAPQEGVALVSVDGHELLWIAHINLLSPHLRQNVLRALTQREFMPRILKLRSVSGWIAPCTWEIDTDRGSTSLLLQGEEDIRRLSATALLVTDGHGVQFLIRDLDQMDRPSRRMLDRFL
jgi:hypothetical protein